MASSMWIAIGAIAVCAIIGDTIVKILKQSRGNHRLDTRLAELELVVEHLDADLNGARKRIEVLEKIVTDQKYDLSRRIEDLAAGE